LFCTIPLVEKKKKKQIWKKGIPRGKNKDMKEL
jgi:hypothetical protein